MSDEPSFDLEEDAMGGNNDARADDLGGQFNDEQDVLFTEGDLRSFEDALNIGRGDSPAPETGGTGSSPFRRPNMAREASPPQRNRGAYMNYFWEPLDSRARPDRIEVGARRMRAARAYPANVQEQLGETLRSIFAARTQGTDYPEVDRVILDHANLTQEEIDGDMNRLEDLQYRADRALGQRLGIPTTDREFAARRQDILNEFESETQNRFQQANRQAGGAQWSDFARAVSEGAERQVRASTERMEQALLRNLKRLSHKAKEYNVEPETFMALRKRERQMQADQQELSPQGNLMVLQMADKIRQLEQQQLRQAPGARREWARGRRGVGYRYGPGGVGRRSPWRTKRMWSSANRDWSLYDVMGVRPLNPQVRADAETNIIARRIFGEMRPTLRQMRTVPNAPYTADMIERAYRLRGLPSVEGIKARKLRHVAKRHVSSIDRVLADWKRVARNTKIDLRSMTY